MSLLHRSGSKNKASLATRPHTTSLCAMALGLSLAAACGDDSETTDGGAGADGPQGPLVVTPAPGGMRRLTTAQILNALEDTLGPQAAALYPPTRDPQLRGFEGIWASEIALTSNEVSGLESKLTEIVNAALAAPSTLATHAPCVSSPTDACFVDVAANVGRAAWRRTLTSDEIARIAAIGAEGKAWATDAGVADPATQGIRYELTAIFQSPNFLYITETGEADAESGYRRLTQVELASRMSYFLTNRGPDRALLDAAEAGGLGDADAIRAQATRLVQLPAARSAMRRFFNEVYLIRDLSNVEKNPTLYPDFNGELAAKLQEQMLLFIDDIIWTRNGDARDMFDSPDMFVDATLAAFYSVTAPANAGFGKVTLPPEQKRAGILGHAAYLARFAHPGQTSPTRRGRFVQERLMCRPMDPPPPGQNIDLPDEDPNAPQTMKAKLTVHMANGSCAGCHSLMDPIGFALENYDAVGKYRDTDRGLYLDTSGATFDLGEFSSAAELGTAIRNSEDASACIVRNFLRSGLGHQEGVGEEDAVLALDKTFGERGYRIQDLLVEFTASPAFYLVGEPK